MHTCVYTCICVSDLVTATKPSSFAGAGGHAEIGVHQENRVKGSVTSFAHRPAQPNPQLPFPHLKHALILIHKALKPLGFNANVNPAPKIKHHLGLLVNKALLTTPAGPAIDDAQ